MSTISTRLPLGSYEWCRKGIMVTPFDKISIAGGPVMKRKLWLLALVSAILLKVGPVIADDMYVVVAGGGVGTKITSLPKIIDTPGFYYLSGNLTATSGAGITINADDVTLDLMGFCLSGNVGNYSISILGRKNVEIRNGTLRNWLFAIRDGAVGNDTRIINIRAQGNNNGIYLSGWHVLVKSCNIDNALKGYGIYIAQGKIVDNLLNNCSTGIYLGYSGIINGNQVTNCDTGISTLEIGNMISGNLLWSCGFGINCLGGSLIGNNITCYGGATGISLSTWAPIVVDQNTVSGDGTHSSGGGSATVWGRNAGLP
jgi:hypothetical protein